MVTRRTLAGLAACAMVLSTASVAVPHEGHTDHDHDDEAGARNSHEVELTDGDRTAGVGFSGDTGESGVTGASVDVWTDPSPQEPPEESDDEGQQPSDSEDSEDSEDAALLPPDIPADEAPLTLPDLAPRPAYRVTIADADGPLTGTDRTLEEFGRQEEYHDSPVLRFTTTIDNLSEHAFELLAHPGQPDPSHEDVLTTDALQCIRWEGPVYEGGQRLCRQYLNVGTLTYHAHHRHLHIDGFATYELRRESNGLPMYGSPAAVVATADKVGWCVSDMGRPRDDEGRPEPHDPWYVECSRVPSPVPFRMGISPGWGDTYHQHFPGQQIPLTDVADGIYWITIRINPPDNAFGLAIRETDRSRNSSWTRVRIFDGGTQVEVLGEIHPASHHYSADPEFIRERRYPDGHEPERHEAPEE